MKVSRNELVAVIKQAFEGLGFSLGDYENAAELIVWAEMHGLQGLKVLQRGKRGFAEVEPVDARNFLLYSGANWDLAGGSCLQLADLALGVLRVQAQKNSDGVVSIMMNNCRHRKLIAKLLADRSSKDFSVSAIWLSRGELAAEQSNLVAMQHARIHAFAPENHGESICYQQYQVAEVPEHAGASIALYAGLSSAAVRKHTELCLPDAAALKLELSHTEMLTHNAAHIANGIEIERDLWDKLVELGVRVLVESTEQSRQGAGE